MRTMRQGFMFMFYGIFVLCTISMRAEESTTTIVSTNNLPYHDIKDDFMPVLDETVLDLLDENIVEPNKSDSNFTREYQEETPIPSSSDERLEFLLNHDGVAAALKNFYNFLGSTSIFPSLSAINTSNLNVAVGKRLFGDLRISERQRNILFGSRNESTLRSRYTATQPTIMPWPNGIIKYDFQYGHFSDKEISDIKAAMDIWQHHTCIKFQKVSRKVREDNYLNIEKHLLYCDVELGWPGPGVRSKLQLREDCMQFSTYLQKLGHVIGLVHEHNLPNRDEYIKVLWANINADFAEGAYKKYEPNAVIFYDTLYDLSSIMHYAVDRFHIQLESLSLMVPDRWMLTHIGNRYRRMLSFSDVKMVNRLYRCGRACTSNVFCPNGGFINQHCGCYTVAEYYRTYCMNNAAYEAECYKMVIRGECDPTSEKHHKLCSKACGFCPRFLPGQKVQPVSLDVCRDVYHEPMRCAAWAKAGLCAKSIFLKRYCAKSCNVCGHHLNKCPNLILDLQCDLAVKKGFCRSKQPAGEYARSMCQSSCQTCMHVTRGKCKNKASEAQCEKWRMQGSCDVQPLAMFKECPATCNRCWYNAGDCENQATINNVNCEQFAMMNRCTAINYRREMRRVCRKTCNTCVISPFAHY